MVKILVDSSCDFDKEEAEKYGVEMLPMEVTFGDTTYLDGVNLSHKEFFEKLIESVEIPKTSQINEFRFSEAFEKLTQNGDEVVAIVLSSKLSNTYNSAVKASKKFGGKVFVVDSLNACIGERVLILYALKLIKQNKSASEIADELNKKKKNIKVLAVLATLKYLRKGGRISSLAAFTGELLSIKPVVAVVDGEVKLVGKAIGSKKGNNLLNQEIEKCGGVDFEMPYCVAYSGLSDTFLQKYLKDHAHIWQHETNEIPTYMIGSTIGTHVGPDAIAVAFFKK